jgi:short-subunit dehydrogenase
MAQVLITGASGGIGLELARVFAEHGNNLILVARTEDKLQALATEMRKLNSIECHVIPCDLAKPGSAGKLFQAVEGLGITIDILVNNAGFGTYGKFHELPLNRELEMIDLNIRSLTELTRLFLPGMIERKSGRILNVASTAGFQPGPMMAVYYATKAFVLHFSEAISNELKGTGVTVTALCPGPTVTGFQEVANIGGSRLGQNAVFQTAREVALDGYNAVMRGHAIKIPGFLNRLMSYSYRIFPRSVVTAVVRKVQDSVK